MDVLCRRTAGSTGLSFQDPRHAGESMLPALDQFNLQVDRDLKKYYVVRKPTWEPVKALRAAER